MIIKDAEKLAESYKKVTQYGSYHAKQRQKERYPDHY
jgi:hypothetical protein